MLHSVRPSVRLSQATRSKTSPAPRITHIQQHWQGGETDATCLTTRCKAKHDVAHPVILLAAC